MHCLTVLEARCLKQSASRAGSALPPAAAGKYWCSLTYGSITPTSASIFTSRSSLCMCLSAGHLFLDWGLTRLIQEIFSRSLITSVKTLYPNKVTFTGTMGRHIFFRRWGAPFTPLQMSCVLFVWIYLSHLRLAKCLSRVEHESSRLIQ